jgi:hypothetical protein
VEKHALITVLPATLCFYPTPSICKCIGRYGIEHSTGRVDVSRNHLRHLDYRETSVVTGVRPAARTDLIDAHRRHRLTLINCGKSH